MLNFITSAYLVALEVRENFFLNLPQGPEGSF